MDFNDINYLYEIDRHLEKTCNELQVNLSAKEAELKTKVHIAVLNLITEKIRVRAISIEKLIEKPGKHECPKN